MEIKEFKNLTEQSINDLFAKAKSTDEAAYVFALLGINSGMEDIGWQPIDETLRLIPDITSIINTPLNQHTKCRLMLLLYCQVTESNYLYHVLYNMLLSIERETPPKVFSFLDQVKNGTPPSVKSKIKQICAKADKLEQSKISKISKILNIIFNSPLRNAISHADFILFKDELRLKHGSTIQKIKLNEISKLVNNTLIFFSVFYEILRIHKTSYKDGYIISDRKNKEGSRLANITLKVHKEYGLCGISTSDPFPLW